MEEKLAAMGGGSHGVVTRVELLGAGITGRQIDYRLQRGSLHREHNGVYRVGHRAPSTEARYLAAVYACGDGAVLSGLAAAYLLGLIRGKPPPPEVTAPTERRVPGVLTSRCRRLAKGDATRWKGIPVTTVPRTLVDLAAVLKPDALARACHEAGIRHGTTPAKVDAVLRRRPNAMGAGALRRVLHGEVRVTLSKLEARFLELLEQAGLPLPDTNRRVGSRRVDCRWPVARLTVELDGYRYHRSRYAWEQDRRREREAHARGDEFRRFTHDDVLEDPAPMLRELGALLQGSTRPRRMA